MEMDIEEAVKELAANLERDWKAKHPNYRPPVGHLLTTDDDWEYKHGYETEDCTIMVEVNGVRIPRPSARLRARDPYLVEMDRLRKVYDERQF